MFKRFYRVFFTNDSNPKKNYKTYPQCHTLPKLYTIKLKKINLDKHSTVHNQCRVRVASECLLKVYSSKHFISVLLFRYLMYKVHKFTELINCIRTGTLVTRDDIQSEVFKKNENRHLKMI